MRMTNLLDHVFSSAVVPRDKLLPVVVDILQTMDTVFGIDVLTEIKATHESNDSVCSMCDECLVLLRQE